MIGYTLQVLSIRGWYWVDGDCMNVYELLESAKRSLAEQRLDFPNDVFRIVCISEVKE